MIELLAVIVILAIILLIAMPIVLNVINEARKGAFDSASYGLVKAAENEYMRAALGGATEDTWYVFTAGVQAVWECSAGTCATTKASTRPALDFSGQAPDSGTIYVEADGSTSLFLTDGVWCSTKASTSTSISTVAVSGTCGSGHEATKPAAE